MRLFLLFPLILLGPGCSRPAALSTSVGTLRDSPATRMDYRYLVDVQSQRNPTAPLQILPGQATGGRAVTQFLVTRPWHGFKSGDTFPDGAEILKERVAHSTPKLKAELRAWNLLLTDSPIILTEADLEPRCEAHMGAMGDVPVLNQTFTPAGTQKFMAFTQAHTGEIIGIIIENRLISAPIIREPVTNGLAQISGGFTTLKEAQILAARLNGAAGIPRKP